jgi:anti-anti-sigma factor
MGVLAVSAAESAGRLVVHVSGECDMSTSGELATALTAALESPLPIEVDLGALHFLDSSGIHVLVTAHRNAQQRRSSLYVTNAAGVVATVLELTGLAGLLAPPSQDAR